jgi:anti-sigma regulatory factor (Ser/Thr protein kinase)
MAMTSPTPLIVEDASQVAAARRAAVQFAERVGFNETGTSNVALVVTEIATNILKHGGGGQILIGTPEGYPRGIEIVGLDGGRGLRDLEACLRDGYSTAGSPGTGLGAIRRLSSSLDIYSAPERGTALVARILIDDRHLVPTPGLAVGTAGAAVAGEEVSGDGWAVERDGRRTIFLVVDGLGHGLTAAEAAREAIRLFRANAKHSPCAIVQALHDGLRSTRGAAVAVTEIRADSGIVKFSGIGNIVACIAGPESPRRHMVSHAGTVGHTVRKVDEFTYPWPKGGVLNEHTDGLGTHWDLERYPGLLQRSPSLISAVLYRDFTRKRDDVVVLAAREMAA